MGDFGQMLRQERERRGIALEELARAAKVGRHHLEALESNDLARLPGGPFNKGFVRAYARHVGLDPEQAVDAYTREERAQGLRSPDADRELPSSRAPFFELRSEGDRPTLVVDWLRLRRGALVLALVAAAGALLWLALGPPGPAPVAAAAAPADTPGMRAMDTASPAGLEGQPPPSNSPPQATRPGTTRLETSRPTVLPSRSPQAPAPSAGAAEGLQVIEAAVGVGLDDHRLERESDRFREGEQAWFWTKNTSLPVV